jgi:tryptophan synthase alpha chain
MDLEETLLKLRNRGEGAFMPHVYYGDPNPLFSRQLITTLAENGADLVEFGIPFSDPTADGPTFQAACERALGNGITPSKCIEGIRQLREGRLKTPIIVTTYYNIPYTMGVGKFFEVIKSAGAQGVIVPNLPFEEAEDMLEEGRKRGMHVILQVAPTTTEDRLKRIADTASGFLYVMNVEGVTGARESVSGSTLKLIERVKKHTDIPLMAGFGISGGEQAEAIMAAGADGVIAGSVFAKIYERKIGAPEKTLKEVGELTLQIKRGCVSGHPGRSKN